MDKRPKYIQVSSPLEFSRLVCALERIPRVSFLHDHEGKKVLSVQMDLLKERPIVYYTPIEHTGHYLCYGFKAGNEESSIVNSTSDSACLYSPIVKIKTLPDTLKAESNNGETKYHPIELEDLASLAQYVDQAAEQGSPIARIILRGTANQISANVSAVATLLGFSGTNFKAAVVGSVIRSFTVKWHLKERLTIEEPFVEVVEPMFPPELGALDIAIKDLY